MRKILLLAGLIIFFASKMIAVPAYPYPIKYTQPDGSQITIQLRGDEQVHWAETSDGYTLLSNGQNGWEYAIKDKAGNLKVSGVLARETGKRLPSELRLINGLPKKMNFSASQVSMLKSTWEAKTGAAKLIGTGSFFNPVVSKSTIGDGRKKVFTPKGVKKLLLILIQYPNLNFTFSKADFQGLMNTQNYNLNGASGSVRDYFLEQSYNQFDVQTDVAGIYTAQNNMEYYGTDGGDGSHDPNAHFLMEEAVTYANADVDFTQYDNDGDGSVDGVYIIYAGKGQASSGIANTIWPHAGGISGQTFDGKTVSKYSCSNELNSNGSLTGIGVICHEFGHVCGAPDYYDTDYSTGGQFPGTGDWDIMCGGCYNGYPANSGNVPSHFNPLEKIRAGWVNPIVLSGSTSLSIPDYTYNPVVYIVNATTPNEYYLLENRQKTGFNQYVDGHGLLIYKYNADYWNAHANKTYPEGFYLVSANITTNPTISTSDPNAYGTVNTGSCPFPGTGNKTLFTDATIPSMQSWVGENTGYPLSGINESGGIVTLCFNDCPSVNSAQNFQAVGAGATQINLSWLNTANVIIARNATNTFGSPVAGMTYSVGNTLSGGGEIVFAGNASSFNDNVGLSASTTFYYRIWVTNGSAEYSLFSAANATTTCLSSSQALFSEGFEGGVIPGCWTQEFVSNTYDWTIATKSGYSSKPASAHGGSKLALFYDGAWKSPVSRLITPPLDLSDAPGPTLKFWHTQASAGSNQDMLYVYYRTSVTDSWKLLQRYTSSILTWTLESIPLPEASSTYYIAFEGHAANGCGICLDDVDVWKDGNSTTNAWLGVTSADWFTASNWSLGIVPTATVDVEIPAGATYSPIISAAGAACQNITINNGAILSMNGSTAYTLSVNGNWVNNGNFVYGLGVVSFDNQTTDQTIGGSTSTNFYMVRVNKGSQSKVLEATAVITLNAPRQNWNSPMEIIAGTFKLSSASTLIPFQNGTTIHSDEGLWNNGGTLNFAGYTLYNQGLFRNSLGASTFSFLCSYSNASQFIIDGGNVTVTGYFGPYSGNTYTTTYTQSGGDFIVNSTGSTIPFNINAPGATFNMSGGNIIIRKASSATYDYQNLASTYNVTGGTLQMGDTYTTSSPGIRINSTVPIWNLIIGATGSPTAKLVTNGLTVKNNLEIGSGSTLDINSLELFLGGSWINNGGSLSTPLSGTVTFNGSAAQTIGGTYGTVFNNLTVDNSIGVAHVAGGIVDIKGSLVINNGKVLEIAPAKQLTASSIINNAGASGLVLQSDATGTATFVNSGVVNNNVLATVNQYLSTKRNWYVSSPVSNATVPPGYACYQYREPGDNAVYESPATAYWKNIIAGSELIAGLGYILLPSSDGLIMGFETGSLGHLNDGEISIPVTKTNGALKSGFNLIGNPYPSYLNVMPVINANAAFDKTIWYRTYSAGANCKYYFETVNTSLGAGTNNAGTGTVTGYIPPMQAFWVKTSADANLVFNNSYRSHSNVSDPVTSLKSPQKTNAQQQLIRLSVSNGSSVDETLIVFNSNAQNGLDDCDSQKMSNEMGSIPEIYSIVDENHLVINGMNSLESVSSIPLGFTTGEANVFSIRAVELSNLEGQSVYLKDNETAKVVELSTGDAYVFNSSATTTDSRFSIMFKTNSAITDVHSTGSFDRLVVFVDEARNIVVHFPELIQNNTKVTVYNQIGQKLYGKSLTENRTMISLNNLTGIYFVKLENGSDCITKKIVVK